MKNISLLLLLGISNILIAQQTFQTTIKTSTDLFGMFFTGDGLTLITGESTYGELKVRVPHD